MGPFAQAKRHDAPWLIDEAVPGEAAMIDDVIVGFEDAIGQPVVAHVLPDIFDRIQFGAAGWQWHEGDIAGHDQLCRAVPSGLVEKQDRMRAWCDMEGDFLKMHAHSLAVAAGHDDRRALAFSRADGAKDPGRSAALIFWGRWPGATLCPAAGELGLLPNAGFVSPPNFYGCSLGQALFDFCQMGGKTFLKSSMSSTR